MLSVIYNFVWDGYCAVGPVGICLVFKFPPVFFFFAVACCHAPVHLTALYDKLGILFPFMYNCL